MTHSTSSPHGPGPEALLRHAGFVRGIARALVRGDADVDDVVQATWLSALEGGPKRPLPVRGWLAAVTRRRAADLYRSRARRSRRELAAARPEAVPPTDVLAERAELGRRVVEAVLALDEPYRSAILLRYHEDLPPREVARRLGVPVETARTRVKRGLARLRERFDEGANGDRRAWMAALLPLAGARGAGTLAAAAVGGGSLLKVALATLVVGAVVFLAWRAADVTPPETPSEGVVRNDAEPVLRGRGRDLAEAAETDASFARGVIEGIVLRGEEPVAARVELRALTAASDGAPLVVMQPDWLYGGIVGAGDPAAVTTSGSDGRFTFDGVRAGGGRCCTYEVRAIAGGAAASARVPLHATRPAGRLRLVLPEGPPVLVGRAVHADGRPFRGWIRVQRTRGASVTATAFGVELDYGDGMYPVDAGGAFSVQGVSPGTIRLYAFRSGEVRYVSPPVIVPCADLYTFVVDEGSAILEGRVVDRDDGHTVPGALVTASALAVGGERSWVRVQTDDLGVFRLVLPPRALSLRVAALGYATVRCGEAQISEAEYLFLGPGSFTTGGSPEFQPVARAADGSLLVRLARAPRLTGRVLEKEGRASVGGVFVYAVAADFTATETWAGTVSHADGTFDLAGAPTGATWVFAAGQGWVSAGLLDAAGGRAPALAHDLPSGGDVSVDLEVVPSVRVAGRVSDASGAPIAGAAVRAQPAEAFPPLGSVLALWLGSDVTDTDGRFVLDPIVPGYAYRVFAQPPGGVQTASDKVEVGNEGLDDLEIRIPEPVWLNVRVLDASTDDGIAYARVRATPRDSAHASLPPTFLTDATGWALVGPLPTGEARVSVEAGGYLARDPRPDWADVSAPEARDLIVRLEPGGSIAGRVTAPEGIAAGGLRVSVETHGRERRRSNHPYSVVTEASGAFRIDGLLPGLDYVLTASVDRGLDAYVAEVKTQAGDLGVTLDLALDTTQTAWAVRLRDRDGTPVVSAETRVHVETPDHGHDAESGAFEDGWFVLRTHAPVGEAWLEIQDARDAAGRPLAAGSVYRRPLPPLGGEVEVTLDAPLRIAGVVEDAAGAGVPGVRVYAYPTYVSVPRWRREREARATASADAAGRFALERLGDGDYTLVFECPPSRRQPAPMQVRAGTEDLVVILERAARPRIRVRDAAGAAVAGARVTALPVPTPPGAREPDPEARTDARGEAEMPALLPDRAYRLRVEPPPERAELAPFEAVPWVPVDREVVLALAAPVAGRVLDAAGEGVARAKVWWRIAGGGWATVSTSEDGAFRLDRLPRGETIELSAQVGFTGSVEPGPDEVVLVQPGNERVVLDVLRPVTVEVHVVDLPSGAEGATAYLVPSGGHPMCTGFTPDGVARFPNIAASGEWEFYAGPFPGGRYARARDIRPGAGPVIATMHAGLEIRGRLLLPPGARKPNVWVATGGMSVGSPDALAPDGSFRFTGLYPGSWVVKAGATVGGTWKSVEVETQAGATDVVVEIE